MVKRGGMLLLIATHPVVPNNNGVLTQAVGSVTMGRFIDPDLLARFSDSLQSRIVLELTDRIGYPEGMSCSEKSCRNEVLITDQHGVIRGALYFDETRDIYLHGIGMIKTLLYLFVAIALIGLGALFLFLNRAIFSRLYQLSSELSRVNFASDSLHPVTVSGQDEITTLTKTVNKMFERLEERNRQERLLYNQSRLVSLGKMTRDIAHHWRQPMQVISLMIQEIQMLGEYGELEHDELEKLTATALKEIREMSGVIDDFQNFYDPKVEKQLFSVQSKVETAVNMERLRMKEAGISLTYDCQDGEACRVFGYEIEFMQVMVSLINNAIEAIEKVGSKGRIAITVHRSGEWVRIDLEDNGGGIDDTIREQVYNPYFSTKSELNGTGLGLYMSKVIIEKNMNGKLLYTNTGEGVRFSIELPSGE